MSLVVLPPSPPTTSSRKERALTFSIPPTSTPDESPASGPPSSLGSRKKVEFSPWTNVHHPVTVADIIKDTEVRALPPSRECSASGKSILKPNVQDNQIGGGQDGSSDEPQSVSEAMESMVQQLIRNDPMECVDAYQTLAAAFKAYNNLPDQAVLRSQLHLITKSIKQHLSVADKVDFQPTDVNLVTSALKVLVILVWDANFSPHLTDDFRAFALDRAISVIHEHKAPKTVIVHYLHFLAVQEFRQSLLNHSRATKLVEGLSVVNEHVKGNGVVSERLLVYTRLLDQAKGIMKARAGIWTDHMLSAMTSTILDTRQKALALGRKACQSFPPTLSIASVFKSVLDTTHDEKHTKGSFVCAKLEKLVRTRDNAESVPQMWAVVILLCNSSNASIVSWTGLTSWLQLIQRCFNASDSSLRAEANFAWNRFIYAARPHEGSDEKLITLLAKPLVAQLERKSTEKAPKSTSSAAMSTYCNLLYYAMRPTVTPQRLNKLWDEYVVKVMRSSFLLNPVNADMACRILISLFWNWRTTQKIWNGNRAHENRPMEPEELPTLDCKWVRSKASPIIKLFAALFKHCPWGLADSVDQAYIARAWRSFVKSVRSAGSKEIKMTTESRSSAASILEFVSKLSADTLKQNADDDDQQVRLTDEVLSSILRITIVELQINTVLELLESETVLVSATVLHALMSELQKSLQADAESVTKQHLDSTLRILDIVNTTVLNTTGDTEVHTELMHKTLLLLKPENTEEGLSRISSSLALLIKDEDRAIPPFHLDRFTELFSRTLRHVQPENIEKFDDLFAAAFGSSHRTIVSSASNLWNEKFGECDELQIGSTLTEALQRVRPYVELRMPPGCMDSWTEERDTMLSYETQESLSIRELHADTRADFGPVQPPTPAPIEEERPKKANDANSRKPRNKPRHEDSQVAFVPVDSSPLGQDESQYLTERQREVRDRQRSGPAVTFADIRSSPRPASRAPSESRDCGLARKAAQLAERPSTPPLPEQGDEDELQPSPTPKSRHIRNIADVEIPSSPPSVHGNHEQQKPVLQNVSSLVLDEDLAVPKAVTASRVPKAVQALDNALIRSGFENEQDESSDVETRAAAEVAGGQNNGDVYVVNDEELETGGIRPEEDVEITGGDLERRPVDIIEEVVAKEPDLEVPEVPESVFAPSESDKQEVAVRADEDKLATAHSPEPSQSEEQELPETSEPQLQPNEDAGDALTTPQRASSRIDSDELQQMSASQLSNDLDWSVVLDGLDSSPINMKRMENEAARQLSSSQTSQGRVPGRKRKTPASGWTRNKKRKTQPARQMSTRESQESFIKIEDDEVDKDDQMNNEHAEDVIEVVITSDSPEPPSSLQPETDDDGDMFVDAPESQETIERKRGKPAGSVQRKKRGQPSQPKGLQTRAGARRARRSVYSAEPEHGSEIRLLGQTQNGPAETEEEAVQARVAVPPVATQPTNGPAPIAQSVNILESLQQTLDAVKNAQPGSLDLRVIDELCFQIRFQAQLNGSI